MNIKRIATLISAISIIGSTAFAENVKINKNGSQIVVGTSIEPKKDAMCTVVKSGYTLSDTEWICAVKGAASDENGEVTFRFSMPEYLNGEKTDGLYVVYTKQTGKKMSEGSYWYASQETTEKCAAALSAVTTEAELNDVLNDASNIIVFNATGFNMTVYNSFSDDVKKVIRNNIISEIGNFSSADITAVKDSFNRQTALAAVNAASGEAIVGTALSGVGFSFDNTDFDDISDEQLKKWISECIYKNRQYESFSKLSEQYKIANILYILNNARFDELTDLFAKYANDMGLTESTVYKSYLAISNKGSTNSKIADKLKSLKPVSVQKLEEIIKDCLPGTTTPSGGNGSGSGGGTGGSGKTGGSTGALPAVSVIPQETNESTLLFSDISEAKWAEKAINAMAERKIITGDGSGKFRPNDSVTKEEFVKMIVTAADIYNEEAACDMTDVDSTKWYYHYVSSAISAGVIYGVTETEFGIGTTLTRQDMAVICARALRMKHDIAEKRADKIFADEDLISEYAKADVHALYKASLIEGMDSDNFAPAEKTTRAQAAQIIYNLFPV